jgi:Zn-dependent metalloprotease
VRNRRKLFGLTFSSLLLIPTLSFAIAPQEESAEDLAILQSQIFARAFTTPDLDVHPSLDTVRSLHGAHGANTAGISQATALSRFYAENSNQWEVRWDSRADRANLIQGVGVPVLPGRGNSLTAARAGLSGEPRVSDVERVLRGFMNQYPELFRVSQEELRLNPKSTVNVGENHEVWFVEFQQVRNGVPVEGANVYFRINNGNIIQFGTEKVAEVNVATTPKITREAAFAAVLGAIRSNIAEVSEIVNAGQLKIIPMLTAGERPGELYKGAAGSGYRHALVWEISFRRAEDPATYQAWVNARTGKVLQLVDVNDYAQVTGGIYPTTNTDAEVVRGLPSCNVTNSTVKVTDSAGNYTYGGGTATVTLNGKYIRISDACGSISKSDSSTGNIAFGTSGGTDCTTPGSGGAGNTHAARTGFYHLTNINRKAASFYPSNSWLAGTLTANMNINNTCNAFWNGSTVNFYRSGGGCSNTGEIAAVFLHEWGHGMDTNSGGSASDKGSGEAVGDTFAFLETKNGCIGPNFRPGVNCANCTACTGVRDVDDFSLGGSATIAKPSNVASDTGINCDRYTCPYTSGLSAYQGPMGYEGHCESYIASSANWDLAQSLTSYWGTTTGWSKMDAIWYKSLTPSKSAYQVASGGKCNPAATVNGCGSTNWYTVFLSADDDDGNLTNGTPNGCRIWDAFNAHGIACGSRPACTQ